MKLDLYAYLDQMVLALADCLPPQHFERARRVMLRLLRTVSDRPGQAQLRGLHQQANALYEAAQRSVQHGNYNQFDRRLSQLDNTLNALEANLHQGQPPR